MLEPLHLPPAPILSPHQAAGVLGIGDPQVLGIPFQRSVGEARGDRTEQHGFGQRRGVFERCRGPAVSENRLDELELVACLSHSDTLILRRVSA